ncbi:MAG: hypothetical protein KAR20_18455, partial [Candidatus Heimdallarchaeota archaeon]|nr:hypothetical protein [Candidatus Heimdallarchaeota archaeon]
YLLGINPTQPGFKEVVIVRTSSGLNNIEGTIPSPEGKLVIQWNLDENSGKLKVDIPGEMKVKLDLESLRVKAGKKVLMDGQPIDTNLNASPYLMLSKGRHIVNF